MIIGNTFHLFETLFFTIMNDGLNINNTKCVFNQHLVITSKDVSFPAWRKFNEKYASEEYDWYKTGNRDITEISKKAKLWKKMADSENKVWSNYGYHWLRNDQLEKAIMLLKNSSTTRRAVVLHYDYNEVDNYEKDTPCNVVLHFQYTDQNTLGLTIFARSIDLVYGFCNDIYCFSRLHQEVASRLMAEVGNIDYFISNLHIYEKHYNMYDKFQK